MGAEEVDSVDGEHAGAGHYCPARQAADPPSAGSGAARGGGGEVRTAWGRGKGRAAVTQLLKEQAECAPAGARLGRAAALAWAALRLIVMVLMAAGVVAGYSDGDEFDDVGCSVAQQPGQTSHGAHSGQVRERGGRMPGAGGGSDGGSGDGGSAGRPECEVRVVACPNRMPDRLCQKSRGLCICFAEAGVPGAAGRSEIRSPKSGGAAWREAETLKAEVLKVARGAGRCVFRKAGSRWRVIFDGGLEFDLEDTLGARYLDYLLHHPNVAISAFDLEVAIRPERAGARSRNMVQSEANPERTRAYLRELTRLRAEREEASDSGRLAEADRLDGEIEALEEAVRNGGRARDTGERARSNVNKALAVVRRRLARGDAAERAFGEHVERFVSVGYQCMYAQPGSGRWA